METVVMKSELLNLPEEMARKLRGREVALFETKEGILLKPLSDPIQAARGFLKGCRFSSERYMHLKKEEKALEE